MKQFNDDDILELEDLENESQQNTFSEKKRHRLVNIPSFQVNQRGFHLINNQHGNKTYLSIFIAHIRSAGGIMGSDPTFITDVIDSEVRQIGVQIFSLWHKLVQVMCADVRVITSKIKSKAIKKFNQKVELSVISKKFINEFRNDHQM